MAAGSKSGAAATGKASGRGRRQDPEAVKARARSSVDSGHRGRAPVERIRAERPTDGGIFPEVQRGKTNWRNCTSITGVRGDGGVFLESESGVENRPLCP